MKGLTSFSLLSLAISALLLNAPATKADSYTFNFVNPDQSAVAGEVVEFDAAITNLDPSNGLYLNFDNLASLDAPLILDDTAFWKIPYPLDSGGGYAGPLFDVTAPLGTAAGSYEGEFQVFGGSNTGASDLLGDEFFTITIGNGASTSPVPEPSSLLLLLSGMAGIAVTLRRRISA